MDVEKKRPGRPRKYTTIPIEACGIVDKPINDDDVVEMMYDNPLMFKKMFSLFSAYGCIEIVISFERDRIVFAANDHHGRAYIRQTISSARLNYYYCPNPIKIAVKKEQISKIMNTLDKSHHKITFVLKENYRSTMYIVVRDFSYENDDLYEVELIDANALNIDVAREYDVSEYPIKFTLESAHFKKKIVDISKISSRFSFIKNGLEPLGIAYDGADRIICSVIYPHAQKIQLESTVEADDTFSASLYVNDILPFAKNCVGPQVNISVDKYKHTMFASTLEMSTGAVCRLEVYTDIIKLIDEPNGGDEV